MKKTNTEATIALVRGDTVIPTPPKYGDFEKALHKANCSFSEIDRAAFNSVLFSLREAANQAHDEACMLPDDVDAEYITQRTKQVKDMVSRIPFLYD